MTQFKYVILGDHTHFEYDSESREVECTHGSCGGILNINEDGSCSVDGIKYNSHTFTNIDSYNAAVEAGICFLDGGSGTIAANDDMDVTNTPTELKLIFLDIDGVLNSSTDFFEVKQFGHPINTAKGGKIINRGHLALLQGIIDATDAKIVLSSTWRLSYSIDEIHEMFKKRGFQSGRDVFYDITPNHKCGFSDNGYNYRGLEIKEYIDGHPSIDKFVILDDVAATILSAGFVKADLSTFHGPESDETFIHTNDMCGLTFVEMRRAIHILGKTPATLLKEEEYHKALDILVRCMV
jgi:hypothetical protein